MHQQEHNALFAAIRSGTPINSGDYMVTSTMLAVIGRMASFSGEALAWEQAMQSKFSLAPTAYAWDAAPPTRPETGGAYPIAKPGVTRQV